MTALAEPVAHAGDDARPLPWQRMAGVIWRQHRFAVAGVAALLGTAAVLVWLAGTSMHQSYAVAVACQPAGSPACTEADLAFFGSFGFLSNGFIFQVLPALIGAFVGAPLLAREMETGTFRYAWTQGFGRRRWALAKLVTLAVAVTVPAWLFSLLLSWYYQPYVAPVNQPLGLTQYNPFFPGLFDLRGVAFAAWTVAAFAVGALVGMLIRRVVPAIAATLAVYAGLAFAAGGFLRGHYLAPLVTSSLNVPQSAWVLSQWWTKGGVTLSQAAVRSAMDAAFAHIGPPAVNGPPGKQQGYSAMQQYLTHHGYTQWTQYQPGTRFWPFQWIEGGWLLALSFLLLTATIWLVHRRVA